MEHISNEQKALEIYPELIDMSYGALPGGDPIVVDVNLPKRKAFLIGTQWKDEQFAQEKQQWIEKLEDWLENNICNAYSFRGDDISSTFINDCIKAMGE